MPNFFQSARARFLLGAIACAAILGFAFYLQYFQYMEPCPLCWFQRAAVFGVALAFAGGALLANNPRAATYTAWLATLVALIGAGIAARHIWIQNLPADQVPACGQGIVYMLDNLPFFDVLTKALKGSGECAKRDLWLGFTLPSWTMLFFALAIVWAWLSARVARRSSLNRF
jgi:protein dithiol:quinone oxidoreductase